MRDWEGKQDSAGMSDIRAGRGVLDGAAWRAVLVGAVAAFAWACAEPGEIEPPRQLGEIPVEYPIDLWDQGMEGETLLRVLVTETGGVDSVEVVQGAGHALFDSAAVTGARQMRFTPARRDDGRRIEAWTDLPVSFSMRPRTDTLGIGLPESLP